MVKFRPEQRGEGNMKRLILESVVTLLLIGGTADATCMYEGVSYSEGARICMHRTMFMCRGKRWIKTAERCWERYSTQEGSLPHAKPGPPGAPAQGHHNVITDDAVAFGEDC